ncbi:MAG TPA: glycosyltransferase family 39 protein [Vicinamibacterales bacterium]|nr:glycosyltransferase family 39 protein [Vicinamibacterales bacterium]
MGDVRRANVALLMLALLYFGLLWLPSFGRQYGYFIDELYYLACASHPAFGYVDHPPLSIMLLALVRAVAGDALPVIRFVPALAGAATILLTGLLARRLGANIVGQTVAAGAAMTGSLYHVMFGFYSMNALELLFWTATLFVLVEIERQGRPALWLGIGLISGLALENKHTFVLLLAGLAVGLLLSPARRHLRSRWLWAGAAIGVALLVPNLVWQAANGWPSIEFYRNADLYKNVPTPPLDVLVQQVLYMNPAAAPVWLAGLAFLLLTERGRPYRHLGWMYVALLLLMLVGQKSRPDRIAGAYSILFAGGGVVIGEAVLRRGWRWVKLALPGALVASGLVLAPVGLPLLAPAATASHAGWLGIVPQIEHGEGKRTALPQWLADRLGWEHLADDVTSVVGRLTPEERARAVIVAPSYGQAGAIERFGRGRELPPVYATQNSYFHWGPPPDGADVAIIIGPVDERFAREAFAEAEIVAVHDCDFCMPWRDEVPIWISRRPREPWSRFWHLLKHYE